MQRKPPSQLATLLKLSPVERLAVANALLDSLEVEAEHANWESDWCLELKSRLQGIQEGTRNTIDAQTVFADVYRRLNVLQR